MKCFGQHTNWTPENNEVPHGVSIEELRICMLRSWQASAPVWFHLSDGQHCEKLWMWSKKHPSGTRSAFDSDGRKPSIKPKIKVNKIGVHKFFQFNFSTSIASFLCAKWIIFIHLKLNIFSYSIYWACFRHFRFRHTNPITITFI